MKASVNISFSDYTKTYYVSSADLEDYNLDSDADNLPSAVEQFIRWIEFEQEEFKRYGQRNEIPDAHKLFNLQLEFVINDKLTEEEQLYVKALNLMLKRHYGQKDKAGREYYFHPMRVSQRCLEIKQKIVALLHDTIEDTGLTPDELRAEGFGEDIINGVFSVTRQEGETYAQFIERANKDILGMIVKEHDLEDNMDITRLTDLTEKDWHRLNKYLHSWRYLNDLEPDTSLIK